jgi:hypothetical protein
MGDAGIGDHVDSPAQCRAARTLLEMELADLARLAGVARDVVVDFENGGRPRRITSPRSAPRSNRMA